MFNKKGMIYKWHARACRKLSKNPLFLGSLKWLPQLPIEKSSLIQWLNIFVSLALMGLTWTLNTQDRGEVLPKTSNASQSWFGWETNTLVLIIPHNLCFRKSAVMFDSQNPFETTLSLCLTVVHKVYVQLFTTSDLCTAWKLKWLGQNIFGIIFCSLSGFCHFKQHNC